MTKDLPFPFLRQWRISTGPFNFQAHDLITLSTDDQFNQLGYNVYEMVETLLLKAAASKPYKDELQHVLTFYGDGFDPLSWRYFPPTSVTSIKWFYLILLASSNPVPTVTWSSCLRSLN